MKLYKMKSLNHQIF